MEICINVSTLAGVTISAVVQLFVLVKLVKLFALFMSLSNLV